MNKQSKEAAIAAKAVSVPLRGKDSHERVVRPLTAPPSRQRFRPLAGKR